MLADSPPEFLAGMRLMMLNMDPARAGQGQGVGTVLKASGEVRRGVACLSAHGFADAVDPGLLVDPTLARSTSCQGRWMRLVASWQVLQLPPA